MEQETDLSLRKLRGKEFRGDMRSRQRPGSHFLSEDAEVG